jgi:DNA processing protein
VASGASVGAPPARPAPAADAERAAAAVLTTLPGIGPVRLRLLLTHHRPTDALAALAARGGGGGGSTVLHPMVRRVLPDSLLPGLRAAAAASRPDALAAHCARLGVRILLDGDPSYPPALAGDPERPAVLFTAGDLDALAARRVAVVGTRNATGAGLATARELGETLAEAGVAVVSGLARGIDGAAHRGVRASAGPGRAVAVVGCGPDRPYPRQHAELWWWVAEHGLLLSEWAPGVEPTAWRFPQRNRIIAALAEVLVVVESRERGGSLITARLAADRGVEVMAVPGSPRCRAASGTNQLLVDGAAPVTSVLDVVTMLGLDHRRHGELPFDPRPRPDAVQQQVLDACRDGAANLDALVTATGRAIHEVALAAARLERDGWLIQADGWFEPAGSRLEPT